MIHDSRIQDTLSWQMEKVGTGIKCRILKFKVRFLSNVGNLSSLIRDGHDLYCLSWHSINKDLQQHTTAQVGEEKKLAWRIWLQIWQFYKMRKLPINMFLMNAWLFPYNSWCEQGFDKHVFMWVIWIYMWPWISTINIYIWPWVSTIIYIYMWP